MGRSGTPVKRYMMVLTNYASVGTMEIGIVDGGIMSMNLR
jgi:hypothetical protein